LQELSGVHVYTRVLCWVRPCFEGCYYNLIFYWMLSTASANFELTE
jgi:hypothetical protein